jgi:hypothetical protein
MKPLAPWHRPAVPHPSDRERRAAWWLRLAFWCAIFAALFIWSNGHDIPAICRN